MSQTTIILLIFIAVWAVTFFPAWWLMLRLLALSASPYRPSWLFWGTLAVYRVVIALPYIVLLALGADVLPDVFELLIVGFVVAGVVFSIVRFAFRKKLIGWLWWIYGFCYDGLLHYAPYRRLIRAVVKRSKQDKPSASSIVELGCGTGNVLVALHEAYPGASLSGVDNSSSMIKIARKKVKKTLITQSDIIEFLKNQPFESHDLIVMQNVLYAVTDRTVLWHELSRVLTADGILVITNSDRAGNLSITKEHMRYGKWYELLSLKLICVGFIDTYISQLSKTGSFYFIDEKTIREETEPYFTMSSVDRVYGDVNILFTLNKKDPHE